MRMLGIYIPKFLTTFSFGGPISAMYCPLWGKKLQNHGMNPASNKRA